jgi:hypothetical protein
MKAFWSILALLTALAIAMHLSRSDDEAPLPSMPPAMATATRPAPAPPAPPAEDDDAETPPLPADDAAPPTAAAPELAAADSSPIEAAATDPAADAGETLPIGLDREIPSATVVAGRVERAEDGSLRADGRFTLAGSGTESDPYLVSWEYLVSAGELYRPRVGDRGIPQRIALLDGAWVRIEGYIAFPSLESTASEALVMLNRWDGCCIGVPPSPYDAIEVKLASPVARRGLHTIDYGTVLGRLSVEPYLIENWLVGLYLMDDAVLRLDL